MRNRATLHNVTATGGPRTMSCCFSVMFKNLAAISGIVGYRTIIVRRRTSSRLIVRHFHLFHLKILIKDIARPSYDVVRWSCDVLRHRTKSHDHRTILPRDPTMMSASRQTIVVKSFDLV